ARGSPGGERVGAGVTHRSRPALGGHQEFFRSGSRARLHAGASIVPAGGGEPTTLPGAGGSLSVLSNTGGTPDGARAGTGIPHPGPARPRPSAPHGSAPDAGRGLAVTW